MRVVFFVTGLILLFGGALEGFLQPWGPTPTEIMAMLLVVGGLILMGIAVLLQSIEQLRDRPRE